MQINILKNGELVRDIGILYFYQLLRELDVENCIQPKLHRNHLSFDTPEGFDMRNALFTQITDELYRAFTRDLSVEKLPENLLNKLDDAPKGKLVELLKEAKVSTDKIQKIVAKSQNIYFPYLRNSGKFGANAGTVANFHQNLKEILQLFIDSLLKEQTRLKQYGEGSYCSVCQENTAPLYDITHKYAIETVEKMKPNKRIIRTDSKYLYTFKGSENNTFTNYGRVNQASSICFECEFFNLLFLLYVKMERPQYLVMTDSLEITYLLQNKIQMKKNVYTKQGFYYQVANLGKSSKVRLYQIMTDANQGILLQAEEIIEYDRLKVQLILMDIVDKFSFFEPTSEEDNKKVSDNAKKRVALINQARNFILNGNYDGAYRVLLNNIGIEETRLAHNYKLLGDFILETSNGLKIGRD